MSLNLDEQLHNADWTKQTCDWPLNELGLCDERPVAKEDDEQESPTEPVWESEPDKLEP